MKEQAINSITSKLYYYANEFTDFCEKTENVTKVKGPLNTSMFNLVCESRLQNSEEIDSIVGEMRNHGKAFSWWISDLDTPAGLQNTLEAKGMVKEHPEIVMTLNKGDYNKPDSIRGKADFRKIETNEDIKHLYRVLAIYDEEAVKFMQSIEDKILSKTSKLDLFMLIDENGKSVTMGSLFKDKNIPSIFDIITDPDERGNGYGTQMMLGIIDYAFDKDIESICLSASSDEGLSIYKKLGFKEIGELHCLEG